MGSHPRRCCKRQTISIRNVLTDSRLVSCMGKFRASSVAHRLNEALRAAGVHKFQNGGNPNVRNTGKRDRSPIRRRAIGYGQSHPSN